MCGLIIGTMILTFLAFALLLHFEHEANVLRHEENMRRLELHGREITPTHPPTKDEEE